MSSEAAFATWAPAEGPWSPWVKPLLFAHEREWTGQSDPELIEVPEPTWLEPTDTVGGYRERTRKRGDLSTAIVVDLPGALGVAWGIAFARKGWRPVPLYNAIPGGVPGGVPMVSSSSQFGAVPVLRDTSALVDVQPIVSAMRRATRVLRELSPPPERPPVFLLDANRRDGVPSPGRFDNRSLSLPTDFPSAVFLRTRGIERVVLVQRLGLEPQEDLAHTLLAWQEGGIAILVKELERDAEPRAIEVKPPSRFRTLWYRALATMGLKRAPLGGFGGTIPIPSAG
jgi:hypothetical protein